MLRPRLAAVSVITLLIPVPAVGDQGDPASYETVVHGRAVEEERPADDPAGFATVLRVKDPPAGTSLARLVERVPGVRVKDGGGGGRKTLSMRGADSQQAVVVLDGVRLSSPSAVGGVDLSMLDPAHLERIEVRRGGGSARFGNAALGGVVSLSTPRTRTRDRTRASVSYGSHDQVAALASHSGSAWRRLRYLAIGSYRQTDGDFRYTHHINGTNHVRHNNDGRQGELLLKGDVMASDSWRVGVITNLAAAYRGAPGILDNPCPHSRQRDLRTLAALKATRYDLLLDDSKLDITLSHRLGSHRFSQPCTPNRPSDTEGHDLSATARLALPLGDTGRLDAGVELTEALMMDHLPEDERAITGDGRADRFTGAVYASSTIRLMADHLVLTPAVRVVAASGLAATVAPKIGLALRPMAGSDNRFLAAIVAAASFGRSYRHPSFHELYVDMDSVRGNPDLEPEDAVDGDLGLRWELPEVALEAVYFRRFIKNMILYAPVSPYLVEANNYPGVEAQGAEASLRLTPGWGVDLRAAYTYTRTRWDEPRVSLPGHPEHRLATRLAWTYPFAGREPRWEVKAWGGATYESGMPLDRSNSITVSSRVLLSAGGSFRYRWVTLAAEGHNLLDRRDLLDSLGFPLAPARFLISLSGAI